MNKSPEIEEKILLPDEIKQAGQDGNLVFFIGAGISRLLGLPSWEQFAEKVLEDLCKEGYLDGSEVKQFIKDLDPKKNLSIAKSISKAEGVELKLGKYFEKKSESGSIYEIINNIGCVYVTTNYDELLVPKSISETDRTRTTKRPERVYFRKDIHPNLLDKPGTVVHLHGYKDEPDTMIVTTEDYLQHYSHDNIQQFLRHLFQKKTVVFLGYGLEEMEILEHIFRQGKIQKTKELRRFNVQGFTPNQKPLYERLHKYYEEAFGVKLLGFSMNSPGNYEAIENIIKDWEGQIKIRKPLLYEKVRHIQEVLTDTPPQRARQEDVLQRIEDEPDLQSTFFQQVKGLEWFALLQEAGYFKPENLPQPKPSKQEGYITVPSWEIVSYLVITAPELVAKEGAPYCREFLSIIENATEYAKENSFSNYHVWRHFIKILPYIPDNLVNSKTIDAIGYWLKDEHDPGLVSRFIGEEWLPDLLNQQNNHAAYIANGLLSKLFRVSFTPDSYAINGIRRKAHFQFDGRWAKRIIEGIASKVGKRLGREGIAVFHNELIHVLKELKKDGRSSDWQPAIEEHDRNSFHDDAENILVAAYRDSLTEFIRSPSGETKEYIREMLDSEYITVQRIAIYCIGKERELYRELWDRIIDKEFFHRNYRHEIWHFLKLNYPFFRSKQKDKTLQIIHGKKEKNKNGNISERASACNRSTWFAAIQDHGDKEKNFYQKEVDIAGREPEHPDFSSYMVSGKVEIFRPSSPYTKNELNGMEISNLVKELKSFKESGRWEEPSIAGLSQSFKDAISSYPLRYLKHLDKFKDLDLAYVHSIITGYSECWSEKAEIPWDDIWYHLLEYVSDIIGQKDFWSLGNIDADNRDDVVKAISALIEAGARSDDYAFGERHHGKVRGILKCLLENQKSVPFDERGDFDAVTIAINSPRGKCVEALINVALRHCRLADKKNDGNHTETWKEFQQYFDTELKRERDVNYEFFALIPEYSRNFLYMSEDWFVKNLEDIFNQKNRKEWLCAMQGYAYLNGFVIEVYQHLKSRGHITCALDDKDLPQECSKRLIQDVTYSFLTNEEQLDDKNSLICILLSRRKSVEIHKIIHFIWSFRPEDREKIIPKIYKLWPRIQSIAQDIGFSSEGGQNLVSSLCCWIEFLDQIDDESEKWLLEIAPYVHFGHFSYDFLRDLARLSEQQPFEVNKILQAMIDGISEHTHGFLGSDTHIKVVFTNLISKEGGIREAKDTASKFVEKGILEFSELLSEILYEQEY